MVDWKDSITALSKQYPFRDMNCGNAFFLLFFEMSGTYIEIPDRYEALSHSFHDLLQRHLKYLSLKTHLAGTNSICDYLIIK